jgi:hypothetical protein
MSAMIMVRIDSHTPVAKQPEIVILAELFNLLLVFRHFECSLENITRCIEDRYFALLVWPTEGQELVGQV